jgi:hypothetical protein
MERVPARHAWFAIEAWPLEGRLRTVPTSATARGALRSDLRNVASSLFKVERCGRAYWNGLTPVVILVNLLQPPLVVVRRGHQAVVHSAVFRYRVPAEPGNKAP